jgi:hypothetical protein
MTGKAVRAVAAVLAVAAAASFAAAAPTAQDHRGNRIEPFRQTPTPVLSDGRNLRRPVRSCTEDRSWCAWLSREPPDRRWTLHVVASGGAGPRHYRYELPIEYCCAGPGRDFVVWDEIVREPLGAALIGVVFGRETGDRRRFWSYQRRLFLLRVPVDRDGVPVPVLEAPLSGVVHQPACISAADQRERRNDCLDLFYFSTLFTLVPSIAPVEPADLVMVAVATTSPGRRSRSGRPARRAPIERTEDPVRDPVCTYTRSYYFDEALGRYLPDAPLPDCSDYLEP